jgi:phage terminase small subunit
VTLSAKQQRFIAEYMPDLNATQAAIRAGYGERGASVQANRLLRNAKVAAEIAERTGERLMKLEITAERVLEELARIAFADTRRLYRANGTPKAIDELDADTAAALAAIDVHEPGSGRGLVRRYRMADKLAALTLLGKHLKLFTEKVDASVDVNASAKGAKEQLLERLKLL